jgi:hypothetical protein
MNEEVNPKPMDEEEMNKKIGKLLWGKDGKPFSMGKLIGHFIKKRFKGFFKK